MAMPAPSRLQEQEPAEQPKYYVEEAFGALGGGPVGALQQVLLERVADWPSVGDPFVEGPKQRIEEIVSTVSRAAGYVCFASALIGVGALISIA